jgi:Mg2+-importing ATPase
VLPFLPMLPTQILLNNLLYDLSEVGIPFDGVRADATARPQVWDMRGLVRFAAVMGPLSSLFDAITFAALYFVFRATPDVFRTAWFLESMATQILVIFIIRTNGRPWLDRPSGTLAATSLVALASALAIPFTPMGTWFGFETPPTAMLAGIAAIVVVYLVIAEALKPMALRTR